MEAAGAASAEEAAAEEAEEAAAEEAEEAAAEEAAAEEAAAEDSRRVISETHFKTYMSITSFPSTGLVLRVLKSSRLHGHDRAHVRDRGVRVTERSRPESVRPHALPRVDVHERPAGRSIRA